MPRALAPWAFRYLVLSLVVGVVALAGAASVADSAFPGQNGRIAFIRANLEESCPSNELWTMDAAGSSQLELAPQLTGVFGGVAWSPDGQTLAFTIQTPQHEVTDVIGVLTVNANGTGVKGLVNLAVPDEWNCRPNGPTWSEDGKRIAVGSSNGIAVIDLENANAVTYIDAGSPVFSDDPAWSPRGGRLAVAIRTTGELGLMPTTGGPPVAVAGTQLSPPPRHPNWSPDGHEVVFERSLGGLSIADLCTGDVRQFTVNLAGDLDPAWSPDGKLIAYWSYGPGTDFSLGTWDIYTQSPNGGPEVNLTNTQYPIVEMSPDWQPTGDPPAPAPCGGHLFVVRSIGNAGDVMKGDGKCDTGEDALPTGSGEEVCTLRAAIEEANETARKDKIAFALTGTPKITVDPDDPLPTVKFPVEIDGTAQPGTGRVEIDGTKEIVSATRRDSYPPGLDIEGGNSTVRGLAMHGFHGFAISLADGGGNRVVDNYLGLDINGMTAMGNGQFQTLSLGGESYIGGGVEVLSPNNTIGGTDSGDRNVIAGNVAIELDNNGFVKWSGGVGIDIFGQAARFNAVQGNYIGTDVSGVALPAGDSRQHYGVLVQEGADGNTIGGVDGVTPGGACTGACNVFTGNVDTGLYLGDEASGNIVYGNFVGSDRTGSLALGNATGIAVAGEASHDNIIGGITAAQRNVISGNNSNGVALIGESHNNTVVGNYIGTRPDGVTALGNGSSGIRISIGHDNRIGGTDDAGEANVIAFNGVTATLVPFQSAGVYVFGAYEDDPEQDRNTIRGNRIHSNRGLGIDLGGDGPDTVDTFDLDAGANTRLNAPKLTAAISDKVAANLEFAVGGGKYMLDFYVNETCDGFFFGEGGVFIGMVTVQVGVTGSMALRSSSPVPLQMGQIITATATDEDGNTSEFSNCITVMPGAELDEAAASGAFTLQLETPPGLTPGSLAMLDPGGENEETQVVQGAGSIVLSTALALDHEAGELVIVRPSLARGDLDCNDEVGAADVLLALRLRGGIAAPYRGGCPTLGRNVAGELWGDADCSGDVGARDVLYLLLEIAGNDPTFADGCPPLLD